jgi:hypothetical protein
VIWKVRIRDVRHHCGGLRWTLIASTPDLETVVHADTTERGSLFDFQSDGYVGTTGDDEVDYLVGEAIRKALTTRNALQRLDELDRQRWGRVQQPRDRWRGAA